MYIYIYMCDTCMYNYIINMYQHAVTFCTPSRFAKCKVHALLRLHLPMGPPKQKTEMKEAWGCDMCFF